jgi:hypothetical protein
MTSNLMLCFQQSCMINFFSVSEEILWSNRICPNPWKPLVSHLWPGALEHQIEKWGSKKSWWRAIGGSWNCEEELLIKCNLCNQSVQSSEARGWRRLINTSSWYARLVKLVVW